DRALEAALAEIHVTRQRRAWWPAPRFISMGHPLRLAAVMAAIVLATVAGATFLPGGRVGGPAPSAGPTPSPSPTPRVLTLATSDAAPLLEPGTYTTADPFPIRVTATVPAGWAGGIGGPYVAHFEKASGGEVYYSK